MGQSAGHGRRGPAELLTRTERDLTVALEVSLARNFYGASSERDLTVALEVSLARNFYGASSERDLTVALEVSLARNFYGASSERDLAVALEVSLARNFYGACRQGGRKRLIRLTIRRSVRRDGVQTCGTFEKSEIRACSVSETRPSRLTSAGAARSVPPSRAAGSRARGIALRVRAFGFPVSLAGAVLSTQDRAFGAPQASLSARGPERRRIARPDGQRRATGVLWSLWGRGRERATALKLSGAPLPRVSLPRVPRLRFFRFADHGQTLTTPVRVLSHVCD